VLSIDLLMAEANGQVLGLLNGFLGLLSELGGVHLSILLSFEPQSRGLN
jgi:hypothetical protein